MHFDFRALVCSVPIVIDRIGAIKCVHISFVEYTNSLGQCLHTNHHTEFNLQNNVNKA